MSFEQLYHAWRDEWDTLLGVSSDPTVVAHGANWDALVAMADANPTVTLVSLNERLKIHYATEFFAMTLTDYIIKHHFPDLKDPDPTARYHGEQKRTRKVTELISKDPRFH